MTNQRPPLLDPRCKRVPAEIHEYVMRTEVAPGYDTAEYKSADDVVWFDEGTLNRRTGMFLCTQCYIEVGQPSSSSGWTVPDDIGPYDFGLSLRKEADF
jgi:hypothetical protein